MHAQAQANAPVSPEQAWRLLADLGALAQWAPDVAASPSDPLRVGAVRRARLRKPAQGKQELVERFVAVGDRHFTYDIEDGIGPLRTIRTTWSVEAVPGGSRVTVSSEVGLAPLARLLTPLVRRTWTRQLQVLVDGFAGWATKNP